MARTIDTITLMNINKVLKEGNYNCSLHSAGACDQSSLKVVSDKAINYEDLCLKINKLLEGKGVKVIPEGNNSIYLKII